jgi:polyphosphate kinase
VNFQENKLDYEPPVTEKLSDLAHVVQTNASQLAERLSGTVMAKPAYQETPPSFQHALAKSAFQSTEFVSVEEPLGAGLQKFAQSYEKLGSLFVQQKRDAVLKFHQPLIKSLEGRIAEALKARRQVQACRLTYDSCRSRLKVATPNKTELVRAEMVESEDEFVAAVDDAINKMKTVVENGEVLRCLSDLVAIQLQYHKVHWIH